MGVRGIEPVTGIHHTTVMTGVKRVGELLRDAYNPESTPEVGELDEIVIQQRRLSPYWVLDTGMA